MTCNDKCKYAKGDLCRCVCDGANHGIKSYDPEDDEKVEIILTFEEAEPFWEKMNRHNTCSCGYEGIHGLEIYGYKHHGGWDIRDGIYWLWVRCPECNYNWSIWKLGVPADVKVQKEISTFLEEGGT